MVKRQFYLSACIISVLAVLLVQNIVYLYTDFCHKPESYHAIIIRLGLYGALTFLFSLPSFFLKNGITPEDRILLRYAYKFLSVGTIVYIASEYIDNSFRAANPDSKCGSPFAQCLFAIGNIYFYFMHFAFILRHKRTTGSSSGFKKPLFDAALIMCIILSIGAVFVFGREVSELQKKVINGFFLTSNIVYAIIILFALIVAYKTWWNNYFHKINSMLIIIGYTSFLFCEIIVITPILFKGDILISKALSSVFYTIAFLLLSLSGFKYKEDFWHH